MGERQKLTKEGEKNVSRNRGKIRGERKERKKGKGRKGKEERGYNKEWSCQ